MTPVAGSRAHATPQPEQDTLLTPGDPRLVMSLVGVEPAQAAGELAQDNARGILEAADVHVARTLVRLAGEPDDAVVPILAYLVAAARTGSSCLALTPEQSLVLRASRLTGGAQNDAPIRLAEDLAYLDRYWRVERSVRDHVLARTTVALPVDVDAARASLQRHLGGPDQREQRVAVAMALLRPLSVLAGGPGTGKTTTVAALVQVLCDVAPNTPHIALAAPTGKAAARLLSSVERQLGASQLARHLHSGTVHSLLKMRPGRAPTFSAGNPLPHEVVVVDETSMVSLPLLAHLLAAVRHTARLVLVGDPDQLASVDVGAVLADLVHRPVPAAAGPDPRLAALLSGSADGGSLRYDPVDAARAVTRLSRGWRFTGDIATFADAIRRGDVEQVAILLDDWQTGPHEWQAEQTARTAADAPGKVGRVRWWPLPDGAAGPPSPEDLPALAAAVSAQATATLRAAQVGDARAALAGLDRHQVLTAHRHGPLGAQRWAALMRRWASATVPGYGNPVGGNPDGYLGAGVVVTRNDPNTGLSNGDVAVLIAASDTAGASAAELVAAFGGGQEIRFLLPGQLPEVLPVSAMTVHRAQGSQYDAVTVVLPGTDSALLTRELLYTAVTRARRDVDVIGDRDAVLSAVANPARRASGLRRVSAWEAPAAVRAT